MKKIFQLCLLLAGATILKAGEPGQAVIPHASPVIRFTENNGQWDPSVLMRASLPGGAMFIENGRLTFNFYDRQKLRSLHNGGLVKGECRDLSIKGHVYRVVFEKASAKPQLQKMQMGSDFENYFLGNDPGRWRSGVRNYSQVWLQSLYPGIDYEILAATSSAKYNFHIRAGADASIIKMRFEGIDQLMLHDGRLFVKTSVNTITEEKPYAYQLIHGTVTEVACDFALADGAVSFIFPKGYNASYDLVIDPILVFSAQIGSVADNFGMTATFDTAGNLYSAGTVYDPGYPTSLGAFDNTFNNQQEYGREDVFVTKYSASGNSLLYSTYLGGSQSEICSSIIVDNSGNLCLFGATSSTNFPVTGGVADPTFNGGQNIGFITSGSVFMAGTDIYVSKFNSNGTMLLASTYFGGSGNDGINYLGGVTPLTYNLAPAPGTGTTNMCGYDSLMTNFGDQFRGEINVDPSGNVYICSSTRSSNLPIVNGFDNTLGGKQDAMIVKFSPNLSTVLYSTFLGGSQVDCGNAIYLNSSGNIFATGGTCSNDMPGTTGAHSPTYNGGKCDGYIASIATNGSLARVTYVGTNSYDNSFFVQCDNFGDVYVLGQSLGNFPVKPRGTSPLYSNTGTHQFISCYNSALTQKNMSTIFGNSTVTVDISPSAFTVDQCSGNIFLSGWGGNILSSSGSMTNMPLSIATQSTTDGHDFYLMALKNDASALLYGSYFGGNVSEEHNDGGTSRFDNNGVLYQSVCAGCGQNQDFPWTPGAWPCPNQSSCPQKNLSGNCNNGVFKLNFDLHAIQSSTFVSTTACVPYATTLTNSLGGYSYLWDLGGGNTTSTTPSPAIIFTVPGTYTISLLVKDTVNSFCVEEKKLVTTYSVFQSQLQATATKTVICIGETTTLSANGATNYAWSGAITGSASSIIFSGNSAQIYTLNVSGNSANGCPGIKTIYVTVDLCTSIYNEGSSTGVVVYPNPNKGSFTISGLEGGIFRIVNALGQTVFKQGAWENQDQTAPVDGLAPGVYLLLVQSPDSSCIRKIVVE